MKIVVLAPARPLFRLLTEFGVIIFFTRARLNQYVPNLSQYQPSHFQMKILAPTITQSLLIFKFCNSSF